MIQCEMPLNTKYSATDLLAIHEGAMVEQFVENT